MKAGLLSLAALSAVAVAQPQHGAHRHRHAKKQAVEYVTETQVSYVTATAEPVHVVVDQFGNTVSPAPAKATPAPAPAPASYDNKHDNKAENNWQAPPPAYSAPSYQAPKEEAPKENQAPAPSSSEAPAAPSQVQHSSAPASSAASYGSDSSDSNGKLGITYSPYNSDNSCKTEDQIRMDMEKIEGYGLVRMYGTDCGQVGPIIMMAKEKNMKVFAGIYDIKNVEQEAATLVAAVDGDWSIIDTVSVGNEGVNNGQYSISDVGYAVETARGCLTGYTGDVVTVETWTAIINNPGLCDVGDYVAANCHAFFDGNVEAKDSGDWVLEQTQKMSAQCGGKRTVITEAGWPSKGSTNNKAVPSYENQQAAVESLKSAFSSDMYLFSAYNGYWKQNNAGTYGVEQYWGIYGDCPSEQ